jgi:hypothetical protein
MRDGTVPAGRGRLRALAVLAAVLASALAIAACGGDDKGDSGATGASGATSSGSGGAAASPAKLSGPPIKTMTIAAVNWNGPAYPNILATAKLYEQWVNDNGGIGGRPLQVTVCDEQGDPNQLATCGRKAVAQDDVAVVGSFTITGDRIVPILEKADISWFGICCPVVPRELNSPITYSFGPGPAGIAGFGPKMAQLGCKTPSLMLIEGPTKSLYVSLVADSLKPYGLTLKNTVTIPVSAQDYSPQVAQVTKDADCVLAIIGEQQWSSFLPAFKQSGAKARLFGSQGNLDEKVAKDFPDVTNKGIVVGYYPNITDPAFADYRAAIAKYKPDASLDYNSLAGLGTWTAYTGFRTIVEDMKGPVTGKTFLAAVRQTNHLDTGGKVPALDLTKKWGAAAPKGSGAESLFTRSVAYLEFDDKGKLHAETPGFTDVSEAMFSRKVPGLG